MNEKKIVVAFSVGEEVLLDGKVQAKVEGIFADENGLSYRCCWFDANQQRQSEYVKTDEISSR